MRSQRKLPPSHNGGPTKLRPLGQQKESKEPSLGKILLAMEGRRLLLMRGALVMEGPINPSPDHQVIEVRCEFEVTGRVAGPRVENRSTSG